MFGRSYLSGYFLHSRYIFIESKLHADEDIITVRVCRKNTSYSFMYVSSCHKPSLKNAIPSLVFFSVPLVPLVLAQAFVWPHRELHLTAEKLKLI